MANCRVVLADDHTMFRQGLRKLLDGVAGLEVVAEAGDGEELLSVLDTAGPDMVILDMSMPKLSGVEALHLLKARHPGIKILVLSMHKEYLNQALAAGADGYLLKEDAPGELFSAIDNISEGLVFLSPRLTEEAMAERHLRTNPLTAREQQVVGLIAKGKSSKEIAEELFVSVRTIESHRASILRELALKNTAELVRYAMEKGYT